MVARMLPNWESGEIIKWWEALVLMMAWGLLRVWKLGKETRTSNGVPSLMTYLAMWSMISFILLSGSTMVTKAKD